MVRNSTSVVGNTKGGEFRYLGSIIKERGDIGEDINRRIRVGWQQ